MFEIPNAYIVVNIKVTGIWKSPSTFGEINQNGKFLLMNFEGDKGFFGCFSRAS